MAYDTKAKKAKPKAKADPMRKAGKTEQTAIATAYANSTAKKGK